MSLFGKKSQWKKVSLYVSLTDWADLSLYAWEATDRLWEATKAPMYYARYSEPHSTEGRVEIQVELDWTREQFETLFKTDTLAPVINQLVVLKWPAGSLAHANAYLLSRELRGKGEALTKDALHWALNMTGYSYAQELRLLGEQVSVLAGNMEKVT